MAKSEKCGRVYRPAEIGHRLQPRMRQLALQTLPSPCSDREKLMRPNNRWPPPSNAAPVWPKLTCRWGESVSSAAIPMVAWTGTGEPSKPNPDFPKDGGNIGFVLLQRGDVEGAINALEKATMFNFRFIQAFATLANAYLMNGEVKKSIETNLKALKLAPDFAVGPQQPGHCLSGRRSAATGHPACRQSRGTGIRGRSGNSERTRPPSQLIRPPWGRDRENGDPATGLKPEREGRRCACQPLPAT